jgi:2-keto-4-pentenoate hydratase
MPIDARIDGGEPIHTNTGEFRRNPVDILVETVNGLSARGIGLAAGDLITTGTLTLPTALHRGQSYVARFGDLMTLSVTMC